MKVRDVVAHMRVVDRALGLGFPRIESSSIVRKYPYDMDVFNVFEDILAWIDEFASENQVQSLGHFSSLRFSARYGEGCRIEVAGQAVDEFMATEPFANCVAFQRLMQSSRSAVASRC